MAKPKWAQGIFNPKNAQKYVGNHQPRYRSSWEFQFMRFCDLTESIIKWASEPLRIPYKHPFTGKITTYVPDFIIQYRNKDGAILTEIVEIKPKNQTLLEGTKKDIRLTQAVAINHAKWAAATAYCKQAGLQFRIITEDHLFHNGIPKNK
jgi:hypothetical protein